MTHPLEAAQVHPPNLRRRFSPLPKAGALHMNHNQTLVRDRGPRQPLKVKTHVKAGRISINHNQTLVRDQAKRK
jgi:hypothetical protein